MSLLNNMPIKPIDYSKGIIYKIFCKDQRIKQSYVGSTTNLTKRRAEHKSRCTNEKDKQYNLPLYKFIRKWGGWGSWSIIIIENFSCKNNMELRARERYHYEQLDYPINIIVPYETEEEHIAKRKQKYDCRCGGRYVLPARSQHIKTAKHLRYLNEPKEEILSSDA